MKARVSPKMTEHILKEHTRVLIIFETCSLGAIMHPYISLDLPDLSWAILQLQKWEQKMFVLPSSHI